MRGRSRLEILPTTPPVMAPMNSDGAKMPPDPPEPRVSDVANILASTNAPISSMGIRSCSARSMVSYPNPKI